MRRTIVQRHFKGQRLEKIMPAKRREKCRRLLKTGMQRAEPVGDRFEKWRWRTFRLEHAHALFASNARAAEVDMDLSRAGLVSAMPSFGMVLTLINRIPRTGDVFSHDGWVVEIADMDAMRIDRLIVTAPAAAAAV